MPVLSGCNFISMQTYTSDSYTIEYPETFTLIEPTDEEKVLMVRGEVGRLEIFKNSDFEPQRIHGFSSSGEDEFEYKLVPKEKIDLGEHTAWVFYPQGDDATKGAYGKIVQSLKIN